MAGNIRELRNFLERLCIMEVKDEISVEQLKEVAGGGSDDFSRPEVLDPPWTQLCQLLR